MKHEVCGRSTRCFWVISGLVWCICHHSCRWNPQAGGGLARTHMLVSWALGSPGAALAPSTLLVWTFPGSPISLCRRDARLSSFPTEVCCNHSFDVFKCVYTSDWPNDPSTSPPLHPLPLSFLLFLSFLPFILTCVDDRLLVLQPSVRAVPLRWESQVQDTGPQETSQLHILSNSENLPEISISTPRPTSTQRPASYSAGHPMPNN